MSGLLNQLFAAMTPERVTDTFLYLMLGIFLLALALRFSGRGREFIDHCPGFLTSLGILGTFIGIIIGLYGFSLEDIDRSIADLMAGLKTAFITSVIGLALSLLLRMLTRMVRLPSDPVTEGATIDDLNRNLVNLRSVLDQHANHVGEAVVEQLAQVVAEFDVRLQAQFGSNLQKFTAQLENLEPVLQAVASEYRAHAERVSEFSQQCRESQSALLEQQSMIERAHERIAGLPQMYRGIDQLLVHQQEQAAQLAKLLKCQGESVQELTALVPKLPQSIERLAQGVASAQQRVDGNLAAIEQLLQGQAKALADQLQSVVKAVRGLEALDPQVMQSLVTSSADMHRQSMRELAQMIAGTHREMIQALSTAIRQELQHADVSIRRQYEQIDREMNRQVEQVLAAMGEALATVSGSFTRDFQQLIAQMRRVRSRELEHAE
ncbi:MotA/TolQ/ExbB proton channel family protein [Microbulbifer guangxiensis]|uniref:MotA/TolQ/ExbB proton channel family protein n=1 Tax=Microbulbifer guangxiensis TaxID=2904249 RepID=UPI001F391CB6|nr:MotA/TolQ/ExbB proton channel family protein [Microbulbifer guangxiensis]